MRILALLTFSPILWENTEAFGFSHAYEVHLGLLLKAPLCTCQKGRVHDNKIVGSLIDFATSLLIAHDRGRLYCPPPSLPSSLLPALVEMRAESKKFSSIFSRDFDVFSSVFHAIFITFLWDFNRLSSLFFMLLLCGTLWVLFSIFSSGFQEVVEGLFCFVTWLISYDFQVAVHAINL